MTVNNNNYNKNADIILAIVTSILVGIVLVWAFLFGPYLISAGKKSDAENVESNVENTERVRLKKPADSRRASV